MQLRFGTVARAPPTALRVQCTSCKAYDPTDCRCTSEQSGPRPRVSQSGSVSCDARHPGHGPHATARLARSRSADLWVWLSRRDRIDVTIVHHAVARPGRDRMRQASGHNGGQASSSTATPGPGCSWRGGFKARPPRRAAAARAHPRARCAGPARASRRQRTRGHQASAV